MNLFNHFHFNCCADNLSLISVTRNNCEPVCMFVQPLNGFSFPKSFLSSSVCQSFCLSRYPRALHRYVELLLGFFFPPYFLRNRS